MKQAHLALNQAFFPYFPGFISNASNEDSQTFLIAASINPKHQIFQKIKSKNWLEDITQIAETF